MMSTTQNDPSSSSAASASTNDAAASMEQQQQEEQQPEVRVYRDCVRGVRRVAGLKRQQLAAGVDVGVASGAGLSLLLSPRHIEFALVIDARCLPTPSSSSSSISAATSSSPSSSSSSSSSSDGPRWLGFSYFGYLENLKRCFRKPHDDLLSYFKIIHENLTTQFSDPYASPLLFVGDSNEKAFWQISSPEAPHSVVGFIPFRPVSLFHSLKCQPIIAMEGGNYPIFTMISGIDRHRLRAVSPELEARYQQTVQTATGLVSPHKLSHLQVHSVLSSKRAASPVANGNANANGLGNNKKKTSTNGRKYSGEVVRKLADDFYKHYASSKSEDKKSLQPILVSGLVLALGSITREVELVTLSMASTGKTHLMQAAQILPPLTTGGGSGGGKALKDNLSDADRLAKELDHYQKRLEQLKLLLAQEPRIAIYNPFLPAASTVLLPTPAPSSSSAAGAASSAAHHHQPPQQQFDISTQTASAAAPSLLTASLQHPRQQPPAATSARHQASTSIEFPSPTPADNNSNSAVNGNGGRQPSPAPAFRAPSTYLPGSSSASTSPSLSLHSSASGQGASVSNSGSGSMTPISSTSHRLATASRPVTPSSFSSSSTTPARPFLRLSASQDFTHAPDMSVLYRRLIELLYVAHPIPGGVSSFAPSALSSPFAHQHPSPGSGGYAGLRGSSTPPPSLGASSASLPVRRFFAPSAAPANTPLSLSRTSSGFIRRSASPSTITFLQPSSSSSSSSTSSSSSWKRFPRATTSIPSTIAFPGPTPAVDYADFVTPEQLLAANGSAGAQRQGDVELASHSPQALHHRHHHRPQPQPQPVSPRVAESPLPHQQPPQPFSHPPQPQPQPYPHPPQQRPMGPPIPVPVQAAPAVAQPQPLPEHHPHAPAAGAPARVLRLSQSHAPHHPRMPEAHFGAHHQQPALRASGGGLAPPAAEAVHPNESASDFLLRLIGANKDASQAVGEEDEARVATEAPAKGPVLLSLEPSHIDRSILASSVAAALAKHQAQHQHHQQQHFGGVHVH